MKIETTLNQIPSLTWNWLKMNRGELKLETSLADEIKAEITGETPLNTDVKNIIKSKLFLACQTSFTM